MDITFSAASTAGLNNPGTEIITLVKDESGNFINPPSYDKMYAYLRSGEVPMLFVTTEGGETGSLYQLVEYSETENKIRFSNDKTTIEFSAGSAAPVVSGVGADDVYVIKQIINGETGTKELQGDYAGALAAWQSGKSLKFVETIRFGEQEIVHNTSFSYAKKSASFEFACYSGDNFVTYTLTESGITGGVDATHVHSLYVDGSGEFFLSSFTEGSSKIFRVKVSDTGELSTEEIT